jgi:hypothetical protein
MPFFSHELFGIAAGIISVIALVPYLKSILKGQTRPSGASWWTWSLITIITVASSWYAGATWKVLVLPLWLCAAQLTVAVLSVKYGDNNWDKTNKLCVAGALFGVGLWLATGEALFALVIGIISDLLASIPNLRHCWNNPEQEDRKGWTLGWVSSVLEMSAVSSWTLAESGWAVYFFLNMTSTLLLVWRPAMQRRVRGV